MGVSEASPNLIMTSLGTKSTNQITAVSTSDTTTPLVVSISRDHTPFRAPPSLAMMRAGVVPTQQQWVGVATGYSPGGSRSKVLQSLAKKISQKTKRLSTNLNTLRPGTQPLPPQATPTSQASGGGGGGGGGSKACSSCGQMNPLYKKRCGFCLEFLVGTPCPSCTSLNYYRAKSCYKCGASWEGGGGVGVAGEVGGVAHCSDKERSHDGGAEVPGSGGSDSSSHPTSPLSPKFSAPPIRSAVLKSLFPQVSGDESHTCLCTQWCCLLTCLCNTILSHN